MLHGNDSKIISIPGMKTALLFLEEADCYLRKIELSNSILR